jgi:ABC-2 type transport system permease protein
MSGNIYDIGYRGYDGPRLGRRHAAATLIRHSTRAVFGLGRGGRAMIMPVICLGGPVLFALVLIVLKAFAARAPGGDMPLFPAHGAMYPNISVFTVLFVAAQAPELLGRDRRYRVLVLYFSRALRRTDYALAKLAAMTIGVLAILLIPQLLLAAGTVLLDPDIGRALGAAVAEMPPILGSSLVIAATTSALAMAVASLTPRRAFATAAIFGVFIIPGIVAAIVIALELGDPSQWIVLLDIGSLLDGVNAWLFGIPPSGEVARGSDVPAAVLALGAVALAVVATISLVWRYQRIEA